MIKTVLLLILCNGIWFCRFSNQNAVTKITTAYSDSISFKDQVQPVLQKHCSPCHFPGGKLYEKLPFDNALTIVEHKKPILRRIKNEADNRLIGDYIRQRTGN